METRICNFITFLQNISSSSAKDISLSERKNEFLKNFDKAEKSFMEIFYTPGFQKECARLELENLEKKKKKLEKKIMELEADDDNNSNSGEIIESEKTESDFKDSDSKKVVGGKRRAGRLPEPVTEEMRRDVSILWHKLLLTNKKKAEKIKSVYFSSSSSSSGEETFDLKEMPDVEFKKFRRELKLFEKSLSSIASSSSSLEEDCVNKRIRLDEDIKSLQQFTENMNKSSGKENTLEKEEVVVEVQEFDPFF